MSNSERPVSFSTTLEVRDHCLCLAAQRAARALARRFDAAFRSLDLTNGQFSLLMALNRPMPPALGQVADFLAMDRTTLTAALKPLTRRGLVAQKADPDDKRSRLLVLTDAGLSLLGRAVPIWRREHQLLDAELAAVAVATDAEGRVIAPLRAGLVALAQTAASVHRDPS